MFQYNANKIRKLHKGLRGGCSLQASLWQMRVAEIQLVVMAKGQ